MTTATRSAVAIDAPAPVRPARCGAPSPELRIRTISLDAARPGHRKLFNYLVGNSDGHAKNLALLYRPGDPVPTLAPFYDLVCIELLNRIGAGAYDRAMAFFVGDHAEPERITRADWEALARAIGVPPRKLLERLRQMAEALPDHARATREAFAVRFGDNQVYDRFEEAVADRCLWTLGSVFGRG